MCAPRIGFGRRGDARVVSPSAPVVRSRTCRKRRSSMPQTVTEQVEAEHGDGDRQAGEQRQVEVPVVHLGALVEHPPHDGVGAGVPRPR